MNEEEEKNKKMFGKYIIYIERKTRVAFTYNVTYF